MGARMERLGQLGSLAIGGAAYSKNFPARGFYARSEVSQQDFKLSQQDSKVSHQDLKVQWDWTAFASLYTKDLVLGSALRGVCRFLCKN